MYAVVVSWETRSAELTTDRMFCGRGVSADGIRCVRIDSMRVLRAAEEGLAQESFRLTFAIFLRLSSRFRR